MFIDNLLDFDNKLETVEVTKKSVISERLNKINKVYFHQLIQSSEIIERNGKKILLQKVGREGR